MARLTRHRWERVLACNSVPCARVIPDAVLGAQAPGRRVAFWGRARVGRLGGSRVRSTTVIRYHTPPREQNGAHMAKMVIVTGGVVSSLGKGIASSSLGLL